jgi:hypothetical protein
LLQCSIAIRPRQEIILSDTEHSARFVLCAEGHVTSGFQGEMRRRADATAITDPTRVRHKRRNAAMAP